MLNQQEKNTLKQLHTKITFNIYSNRFQQYLGTPRVKVIDNPKFGTEFPLTIG